MTTMDLKSISWVGDVYQRFESLCVEAEENMYQDTVKYVEDQVKTVGATVKKFYSEVMQDLLPPSSMNTEKEENPILTVVHHADIVASKKTEVENMKGDLSTKAEQMVKYSEAGANGDNNVNCESCSSSVCSEEKPYETKYLNTAEEKCTNEKFERDWVEWDSSNLSVCAGKDLDDGRDSKSMCLSNRSSLNASMEGDSVELFTHTEALNKGNKPLSGVKGISGKSISVSQVRQSEDGAVVAEQMTDDRESVVADKESKAISSENASPDFYVSSNADTEPTITNEEQNTEDIDLGLFVSELGISDPLVGREIESGEADKQGLDISEQLDKLKLGESCVLVEKSEHSFMLPLQHEQKTQKKKIRDLFSPRKWTKGKRAQLQLAVCYEQQNGNDSTPTSPMHAVIKGSQSDESEWELV